MNSESTKLIDSLFEQAKGVIDPELGLDIVELGMLTSIEISNAGVATARVALTTASCPLRGQISRDLVTRLTSVPGVSSVEIEVSVMDASQKSKVMALARKAAQISNNTCIPPDARILAIASGKGGVGKSSVTALLAREMAKRGLKVGLLDADIWGFSIPEMFGLARTKLQASGSAERWTITPHVERIGKGELKIVSMGMLADSDETAIMWRGLMLSRAVQHFLEDVEWNGVDYLLIDMPPGTGDVSMAIARYAPKTEVIIVTTPSTSASKVAARMGDMSRKGHLRLVGVVENMSYFDCGHGERFNLFGSGGGDQLAQGLGIPLIAKLPFLSPTTNEDRSDIGRLPTVEAEEVFADLAGLICEKFAPIYEMSGCSTRMIDAIEALLEPGNVH